MVSKTIGIDSGSRRRRLRLSGVGKVAAKASDSMELMVAIEFTKGIMVSIPT